MQPIKAYYDGNAFIPFEPVNARKNQAAYITLLDSQEQLDQPWRRFFGAMTPAQAKEIEDALLETERVDTNEW